MSAAVNAFGDPLGPRGRRRALVASVVSGLVVLVLLYLAYRRLSDRGQLDARRWEELLSGEGLEFLATGLVNTVRVAAVAIVTSLAVGTVVALGRLSRLAPVRWVATTYVQLFRALPSLLLIIFSFYGLNQLFIDQGSATRVSAEVAIVLGLTLYNSAVIAEVVRAGVRSLPRGQSEAASALGLRRGQAQRFVLLPQAFLRMLPALVSQAVTTLKDTAYGTVIGFDDLLRRGQLAGETTRSPLQGLVLAAVGYIVLCFVVSQVAAYLERRVTRRFGGRAQVTGVEDVTT